MTCLMTKLRYLLLIPLLTSCAPLVPKAELELYLDTYTRVHGTTNTLLDLVVPYERAVIKGIATRGLAVTSNAPGPGLPPGVDASLLVLSPTSASDRELDEALSEAKRKLGLDRCPTGEREFCYALRDAFASIGDPPLVRSVRRVSNVVLRFNALLAAYASGASANVLAADLARLQADIGILTTALPTGGTPPPVIAGAFGVLESLGKPLVAAADREQFRVYLQRNYDAVDQALGMLAESSEVLYGNVRTGTILLRRASQDPAASKALDARRDGMRRALANWSVLMDDVRARLRELKVAVDHPQGFETRLRNLGLIDIQTMTDVEIVNRELLDLIGGTN